MVCVWMCVIGWLQFSGRVRSPFLGIGTIPESTHSGGLFPKYVSLQNFNIYIYIYI